MVIMNNEMVCNATQIASGQYAITLTVKEIDLLLKERMFIFNDSSQGEAEIKRNARRDADIKQIATLIRRNEYFFDSMRFAVSDDPGNVEYSGNTLRIRGGLFVIDGFRRINACGVVAASGEDEIANSRFTATIYCVDIEKYKAMCDQFAHGMTRKKKELSSQWLSHTIQDIIDEINNDPNADHIYAGKISSDENAVIRQYALEDCILEYFPSGYKIAPKSKELAEYLVEFLNIAFGYYGDDFADPKSSIASGRFITTAYGTYLMIILASWTFPQHKKDKVKWAATLAMAFEKLDVYDVNLCERELSHGVNMDVIKTRLYDRVRDAMKGESEMSENEYRIWLSRNLDEDKTVSDIRRSRRLSIVDNMLKAVSESERAYGKKLEECRGDEASEIIRDVVAKFKRNYAYAISRELASYLDWLAENKGIEFSDAARACCGSWKINYSELDRSYYASIDDLRKTLDVLLPLKEFVTQRDYDRIIMQLIFYGFTVNEAISLPVDALNGNIVSGYGKQIEIDSVLEKAIRAYQDNKIRFSDESDVEHARRYKIDPDTALVALNTTPPSKGTLSNFRNRLINYSNLSDKKLNGDSIWRSGVYSRMITSGTMIDPVTRYTLDKHAVPDFEMYKQIYYPSK